MARVIIFDQKRLTPLPAICPFCGSKDTALLFQASGLLDMAGFCGITHYVACLACHARGPELEDEGMAVEAWNNRIG